MKRGRKRNDVLLKRVQEQRMSGELQEAKKGRTDHGCKGILRNKDLQGI